MPRNDEDDVIVAEEAEAVAAATITRTVGLWVVVVATRSVVVTAKKEDAALHRLFRFRSCGCRDGVGCKLPLWNLNSLSLSFLERSAAPFFGLVHADDIAVAMVDTCVVIVLQFFGRYRCRVSTRRCADGWTDPRVGSSTT